MSLVDAIGVVASVLSVLSLAPQVVKTWRTRSAEDLSYFWLLTALAAMLLWIAYAALKPDWVLLITNVLVGALVVLLLTMKRAYARRK